MKTCIFAAAMLVLLLLIAHDVAGRVIPVECGRRLYEALPAGIENALGGDSPGGS
ncbi:MAG: hypothetical protein JNM65_18345 [Verrucomicrobiaceae bacterium]|nr:hypothetical protein [Verrucomicrobiaceae bacterium]